MLDLGMNAKRQRRPSVRLREVGDVPAASACWFSQATREFLSWENGFIPILELGDGQSRDKTQPGFSSSTDEPPEIEKENPDSSKSHFDHDLGTVTWKTRKPRGRSMPGTGALGPDLRSRDGAESGSRESSGWFGSNSRGECNPKNDGSGDIHRNRDTNGVRRWLEDRGFGEYADVFEMHEVDEEALPLLTLTDLKEMGVFAVGHRRKLYAAIQQLRCFLEI